MYNYQSPIEIIAKEVQTKIENDCVALCQQYGFHIDKDELSRALSFDRNQYDKGFKDGYDQALNEIKELTEKIETYKNAYRIMSDALENEVTKYEKNNM